MGSQYNVINQIRPKAGCIVEIGSWNGDNSTPILHKYCKDNGLKFYTVDVDQKVCARVKDGGYGESYCMTGEKFMKEIDRKSVV